MQDIAQATQRFYEKMRSRRSQEAEQIAADNAAFLALVERDPVAAAEQVDRRCPYCEALLVPSIVTLPPLPWKADNRHVSFPDLCRCEAETRALVQCEADRIENEEKQANREWSHILQVAGLTGKLAEATFETFLNRPEWPAARVCREIAQEYSKSLLTGTLGEKTWLIFCGQFGLGKSHLAAAIVRRVLEAGWRRCYFRVWVEATDDIKASWDRDGDGKWVTGQRESEIKAALRTARLLVIDDLDKKAPTNWTRETLFPLINYRLNERLPTVLTFNVTKLDQRDEIAPGRYALEEYVGRATFDRLIEAAWYVQTFDGPSYRSGIDWSQELPDWTSRKDVGIGA